MTRDLPLGEATPYPTRYDPTLLVPIPRAVGRARLGLPDPPPFTGVDLWNAWELSWLDPRGKPVVATGALTVPASTPQLVESKSLKLYLNSLNGERFADADEVSARIVADLAGVLGGTPSLALTLGGDGPADGGAALARAPGISLDALELDVDTYAVDATLLDGATSPDAPPVDETLHTHLLKSNCPVTGQPDWATLVVRYRGAPIDHAALLRYVISYRQHDEFHEQCVERIFTDLAARCAPERLSVLARYTRRGGLDINPFRTDFEDAPPSLRLWRQ